MMGFRTIRREVLGLSVDVGRFAIAILLWFALVRFEVARLLLPAALPPVILFIGLAAIPIKSAMPRASGNQASWQQAHASPRA